MGGALCMPQPDDNFAVCVQQVGDVSCPIGPYGSKLLGYQSVNDTRACTSCSCSGASGVSCGGGWTEYNGGGCSGGNVLGTSGLGECEPANSGGYGMYSASTSGGSCAPSTPQAQGTATPSGPVTFCCLP